MTMFIVIPVSVALGLPDSWPVVALKLAQVGAFWIENVSLPPSESLAVGVKLYWVPTVTPVMGVPDIVAVAGAPAASAVDDASGLTVTLSPPPQPAKIRVSETSAVAQMALISLKSYTPSESGKCRWRGKRTHASTTKTVQSHSP
jgi:hypothetical protein